ncbi:TRIC cation channel family protein [Pullulanibacillus sp. KACC 23026]|uniref:trimeric intracellular cation channel family protein n=1 Tax=Pullulanibacillus sp. KACC 23026 TaxID=3028315 RepID=UPI0023AF024C|nr:TRIC cation channel family protein [Pullulanibacillus sp. KACC 23026]WEG11022.1 TRIC cation channel family protein [Pullulanibacillus sp. KACC 23026]
MSWIVLHIIGIVAYAVSGALVAIEAKYSFIGIYVLGLSTSFGGAVIRNIIIGAPLSSIWNSTTITIVFLTLTVIVFLPTKWTQHWKKWGLFFDSIGLATFALQGAMSAKMVHDYLGLLLLSAMFTGLGGGMIRDILAGKKPLALKEEVHAVLTILCGLCIWLDWDNPIQLTLVVFGVVSLRMLAIKFNWRFPFPCSLGENKQE